MRHRRLRRSRFARIHPPELDSTEGALIRNAVGALWSERGAEAIPPSLLTNARVRIAYGLGGRPAPERAALGDVPFGEDEDDPRAAAAARARHQADFDRISEWWAENGPAEPVPWAGGHVGRAIRLVGRTLGLVHLETEILQLAVASSLSSGVERVMQHARILRRDDLVDFVAAALARRPADVRPRLAPLAAVLGTGLVHVIPQMDPSGGWSLGTDPRLVALALEGHVRRDKLLARFLLPEPRAALGPDDFPHLGADLEALQRVLRGALAGRERGHNYLLYGPSGVGKTEVARLLAASVGAELFAAAAADEDGDAIPPDQRLTSLRVGHRMLAAARAVMVFDELEDLDPTNWEREQGARAVGKLFMNRLLERNPTPTIWISNSLHAVDPAFLRRFTFALRFPALGPEQRRRVWTRVTAGALEPGEIEALAAGYDVSPGEIASAVRAARAAGGGTVDRGALDRILAGAVRVMGRRPAPAVRAGPEYRLEAVNASVDLARLVERLCAWRPGTGAGVSLCLYGRPGTGKSELVAYVAKRMGRPLVARRVSDLLSMWVGGTEQNIAEAFEDADRQGAVLLLDECDSFLRDRRFAQHSWERTQVNELLQQIEAFRGFVACTTNLFRDLDQAVLRRFVHKVELLPLLPHQAAFLWEAHLGRFAPARSDEGPEALAAALRRIPSLTPGDFAVVARRAAQLGEAWTGEALLRELEAEAAARDGEPRPIGFQE